MIKTDYIFDGKEVSYEILDNGYKIYLNGKEWITQIEPLIPYPELSYEQGCLKQIEEICNPVTPEPTETEKRLSALEGGQETQDGAIEELASIIGGE